MKSFKQFCEDIDAKTNATKDMILDFLKNALNITDDETILSMNTKDISDKVLSDLMSRGLINTSSPDIGNRIKNGMTVSELIDAVAQPDIT